MMFLIDPTTSERRSDSECRLSHLSAIRPALIAHLSDPRYWRLEFSSSRSAIVRDDLVCTTNAFLSLFEDLLLGFAPLFLEISERQPHYHANLPIAVHPDRTFLRPLVKLRRSSRDGSTVRHMSSTRIVVLIRTKCHWNAARVA